VAVPTIDDGAAAEAGNEALMVQIGRSGGGLPDVAGGAAPIPAMRPRGPAPGQ
jgi:hypothetical protein